MNAEASRPWSVLVTAVGGDLGQAVAKALRLRRPAPTVHGCDAGEPAGTVGGCFVDSFERVPPASERERYLDSVDALARTVEADVVIPTHESEILALASTPRWPKLPGGAVVVTQPRGWIEAYGDKLHCMRNLSGLSAIPMYADGRSEADVRRLVGDAGFPLVVKERRGSGSRNIAVVHDVVELGRALDRAKSPLVQEFIDDGGGEFSVGVFACDAFTEAIAFRRTLGPVGASWFAETDPDLPVLEAAFAVAGHAKLRGSANLQFRKGKSGVRLMEINPRFSSLVAARAFAGFRDLEWQVAVALGERPRRPTSPYRHIRFRRFFHELVDQGQGYEPVPAWAPRHASNTYERRPPSS